MALRRGRTAVRAWIAAGACVVLVAVVVVLAQQGRSGSTAGEGSRPVVTFIGDSWTAGTGSESGRGYAAPAAERAGWTSHVLGISGTGYLQGTPGQDFAGRVGRAAGTDPDVVVVQGSLNDDRSDPAALEPAVRNTLSDLRAAVGPGPVVLVIGASHTPGTDPATIESLNDAIGSAAETVGVRFVDPAEENWNDPADPTIWADPIHPNDAGYRLVADRVSELLRESVQG
jgi:lysophospholipase L1-like esterase